MRTHPKRVIYFKKEFCGTMGHKTKGSYVNGSVMHVGDLVAIYCDGRYTSNSLVVRDKGGSAYIMGLADIGDKYKNGAYYNFSISLIKKYYNVADGMYRSGLLEVVTLENDPHLVAPSKKVTEQKKKTSPITVKVEADLVFKQPEVEDVNGEDVFILSGRSVIYFNKSLGTYGIATCNSNELELYNKEIGKALAFYRTHMKLAEE